MMVTGALTIPRSEVRRGSLRAPWVHVALLFVAYIVILTVYFARLPALPGATLISSVLLAGMLEALAFGCLCTLLLGMGPLRGSLPRTVLYAVIVIVFTMTSVVQGYALLISNSFVSVLALENTEEAFLTASLARNALLVATGVACVVMLLYSWRSAGRQLPRRRQLGLLLAALLCCAGVAALNGGTSSAGSEAHLASGQSPLAAMIRAGLDLHTPAEVSDGSPGPSAGESVCGVILGSGRYPFLRDGLGAAQALPFPATRAVQQPNVIVLFVEGESARLFETYGGRYPGLTPNVSRMASQAMVVDNYFNHTAATFRGLQGVLTSGYPFHGGADGGAGWREGNASSYARRSYASLPKLLHRRGYETVFFSPHPRSDALTSLVGMLGFDDIYTATRSRSELLHVAEPLFRQSLTDREAYGSLTRFLQQRKDATPFFASLYSVGTHAFLDIPADGIPYRGGDEPSLNTLHTTDAEFGAFYDYFMSSPYAANTILVLTVDHAHYAEPPYVRVAGDHYKPYFVDQVPLLIHAPWLKLPARLDAHGRTSVDLAPTLLQLLGIDKVRNSFLGYSLFDRRHDRDFSVAAIGRAVYAIYQGQVYAPGEIPDQIAAGYAQCGALVKAYYTHEVANTIFPAGAGHGETVAPAPATADAGLDGYAIRLPASALAAARPAGHCALDRVDGNTLKRGVATTIRSGQPFTTGGWVVDGGGTAPAQFRLLLRGDSEAYGFQARTGVPRPDVARVLQASDAVRSGFNITVYPDDVPAGTYRMMSLVDRGAAGTEICDMQRQLLVGPGHAP